ncbi:MAG TPA: wax ester/triacylglycerol synthase family O-acyltransferase [Myxococcales bacterium]|nr:wax ester/triacylglycerol synthase family O-acyltransferase [Myxococcales bacterium]HIL01943.1 wax ester/triacylglycerol synthase family O-acyltransferase [Myxococcales bacterium]
MPKTYSDRLSAQDNSFLLMETPNCHMHVSSTLIYEAAALRGSDGGIDFSRIKLATESYLHLIPRYRQKLHFIPLENHAVWVDDRHFSLDYHIRHTALPKPGTEAQLKKLSARIMAQPLDRTRPLWETWIVEGLENDRFAVITKIHHCMIDGSSGVDIAQIMMSTDPNAPIPEAPIFAPRPAPANTQLLREEVWRRTSLPLQILKGINAFVTETEDLATEVTARAKILWETLGQGLKASATPMNGPPSPHRKFDWHEMPLADIKAIRKGLDCSVNDAVLTIVTGAVREFLKMRGASPEDLEFKISTPVSTRKEKDKGRLGNRVSSWIISLPIDEDDPKRQLEKIHATTQGLKQTNQALGVEMIMKVAEVAPASLLSLGAQSVSGPINSIVTNVPGPQVPLYLQGAKLLSLFPQVPLLGEMGLGIALMSYDGKICWGFNANPDVIPDLGAFVSFIRSAIDRVAATAGVTVSTSATNIAATKKTARPRKEKLDSQDKGIDVGETVLPGGDRVEPTSA